MNQKELISKITSKKEFSQLPKKDVEMAFSHFDNEKYSDGEKIKFTRSLLKKIFGAFSGRRLLSKRPKEISWILTHHTSTRERLPYYKKLYQKLLKNFKGNIIDLGCGINGFSYKYFPEKINYIGVEAVRQLADLTNNYFKKEKFKSRVHHLSLFELNKIKGLIKKQRGKKIVFLFKTLDSLEILKRDYSKKLLLEIVPLADKIVVSFATRSLIKKEKFKVKRNWLKNFINENFKIIDEFELGSEKYLVFQKQQNLKKILSIIY